MNDARPTTPSDLLRRAAKKLRKTAFVPLGDWRVEPSGGRWLVETSEDGHRQVLAEASDPKVGAWIATVHPGLAEPLAAWLEDVAAHFAAAEKMYPDLPEPDDSPPFAVARSILGEQDGDDRG